MSLVVHVANVLTVDTRQYLRAVSPTGVQPYPRRPTTQQARFTLATGTRSRRPESVLGMHPPGKQPGLSLEDRLQVRQMSASPPLSPVNTMVGSVSVAYCSIEAPRAAAKQNNFRIISAARANGHLFERSFAGAIPLAV